MLTVCFWVRLDNISISCLIDYIAVIWERNPSSDFFGLYVCGVEMAGDTLTSHDRNGAHERNIITERQVYFSNGVMEGSWRGGRVFLARLRYKYGPSVCCVTSVYTSCLVFSTTLRFSAGYIFYELSKVRFLRPRLKCKYGRRARSPGSPYGSKHV